MTQTITIDPVTRLEGHGKITHPARRCRARLNNAYFHVTQVRGFEKFSEGRPVLRDAEPDGAHLRHLPCQPPARVGQGVRSHHVGAHSAYRRASCGGC